MRVIAVSVLLLTFVGVSFAQVPKGNVFIGYSYLSEDINASSRPNLNGWEGSLEGKVLPFIGIVADGSGHYGTTRVFRCPLPPGVGCASAANGSLYTALFGPRISASFGRFRPFAHVLVGAAAESGSSSDFSLAAAFGGGADFRIAPCWAGACRGLHSHAFCWRGGRAFSLLHRNCFAILSEDELQRG